MDGSPAFVPGELHLFGFPRAPARVGVERHAPPARMHRALVVLGACWGIGAVSVLIPIAHFVLVPLFLVAGVVLAMRRLREAASVTSVEGRCPRCDADRKFDAGGALREESRVTCPACHSTLDLEVARAAVTGTVSAA